MSKLQQMIHKHFLEYSRELKVLEKEIVRKYKAGEDYSSDVKKASGIKLMQKEAVLMMARRS